MKAEIRRQTAAEMIAFVHSDAVQFNGAQLGMINRWVELLQLTVTEANTTIEDEGKKKKTPEKK